VGALWANWECEGEEGSAKLLLVSEKPSDDVGDDGGWLRSDPGCLTDEFDARSFDGKPERDRDACDWAVRGELSSVLLSSLGSSLGRSVGVAAPER